jgi:hypothetical protein
MEVSTPADMAMASADSSSPFVLYQFLQKENKNEEAMPVKKKAFDEQWKYAAFALTSSGIL